LILISSFFSSSTKNATIHTSNPSLPLSPLTHSPLPLLHLTRLPYWPNPNPHHLASAALRNPLHPSNPPLAPCLRRWPRSLPPRAPPPRRAPSPRFPPPPRRRCPACPGPPSRCPHRRRRRPRSPRRGAHRRERQHLYKGHAVYGWFARPGWIPAAVRRDGGEESEGTGRNCGWENQYGWVWNGKHHWSFCISGSLS